MKRTSVGKNNGGSSSSASNMQMHSAANGPGQSFTSSNRSSAKGLKRTVQTFSTYTGEKSNQGSSNKKDSFMNSEKN